MIHPFVHPSRLNARQNLSEARLQVPKLFTQNDPEKAKLSDAQYSFRHDPFCFHVKYSGNSNRFSIHCKIVRSFFLRKLRYVPDLKTK